MRILLATLVLFAFAAPSLASMQIIGGLDPIAIPNHNDFKSGIAGAGNDFADFGLDYLFNGGADINVNESGTLIFRAHASESGWDTGFNTPSGNTAETSNFFNAGLALAPITPFATINVAANTTFSSLGIGFVVNQTPRPGAALDGPAGSQGFGVFFDSSAGTPTATDEFDVLYFGFDDNGANTDDNHDDLIVSAVFLPTSNGQGEYVPEPASVAVWAGLIGVASLITRRRCRRCRR